MGREDVGGIVMGVVSKIRLRVRWRRAGGHIRVVVLATGEPERAKMAAKPPIFAS